MVRRSSVASTGGHTRRGHCPFRYAAGIARAGHRRYRSEMSSDVSAKRAAMLADLSSPRQRISDEHMFLLPAGTGRRATFRLQLFTASGARPVAVATQMTGAGDRASLINVAEHCAAEVWRRRFPDDSQPPIWVQHMIMGDRRHLRLVSFAPGAAEYALHNPRWTPVTPADVDMLVGQPVDLKRGEGFVPALPEPEAEPVYAAALDTFCDQGLAGDGGDRPVPVR